MPRLEADRKLIHAMHKTIKSVTDDMEKFRFNTMLAKMMEYVNSMNASYDSVSASAWNEAVEKLVLLLAPSTPHLSEELWHRAGHKDSVHLEQWPKYDDALTVEEMLTLVVQVNGKVRDKLEIPAGTPQEDVRQMALGRERIQPYMDGHQVKDVIYVPNRP